MKHNIKKKGIFDVLAFANIIKNQDENTFLHLSDAHLKDSTDLRERNTNVMVNGLKQMGDFDECILIFSGDITLAGAP